MSLNKFRYVLPMYEQHNYGHCASSKLALQDLPRKTILGPKDTVSAIGASET